MNTTDLLEQLLRAGQGSRAQQGTAAWHRKTAWAACWEGCLAAAVQRVALAVLVVYWAGFWVAAARLALPRAALRVAPIMPRWRRWA